MFRFIPIFLTLFFMGLPFFASAQPVKEYRFAYKSYQTYLRAWAKAPNGDRLLAAEVYTDVFERALRDSTIEALLGVDRELNYSGDYIALIILTDSNFKIKTAEVLPSFRSSTVLYSEADSSFWIGASRLHYDLGVSDSYWQPVFLKLKPHKMEWRYYSSEVPYSCQVEDMAVEGDELLVLGSRIYSRGSSGNSKPVWLHFSTTKAYTAGKERMYQRCLSLLRQTDSHMDTLPCLTLTKMHKRGDTYYVGASTACALAYRGMFVFSYTQGKSKTEALDIYPLRPERLPVLTAFLPLHDGNFLLAYMPSSYNTRLMLRKVNPQMDLIWEHDVDDGEYGYYKTPLLELPDGRLLLLRATVQKNWGYSVYDADGKLLQQIDSQQSKKNHFDGIYLLDAYTVLGSMSLQKASEPMILQTIHLN